MTNEHSAPALAILAIPSTVRVQIAGVSRDLVVRQVAPGTHLGILLLACDPELTEAAGRELAARMPADVDVIVMPDGKAQALLHVVQRETRRPAVLVRKEKKSYLVEPVLESTAESGRLGDVGVTSKLDVEYGYERRITLDQLSNFGVVP